MPRKSKWFIWLMTALILTLLLGVFLLALGVSGYAPAAEPLII